MGIESHSSLPPPSDFGAGLGEGLSVGQRLRTARAAAGLQTASLAAALKVPVEKIEALEADRPDLLPDRVFARALAASVCRQLKIDPKPVLDAFPPVASPQPFRVPSDLNTPFPQSGVLRLRQAFQQRHPVAWSAVLLVLGALAIWLWPQPQPQSGLEPPGPAPLATAPAGAEPPGSVPAPPAPLSAASVAALSVNAGPLAPGGLDAAGQEAPAPLVQASAAAALERGRSDVLRFQPRVDTWIEVVDSTGRAVVRRIVKAGEQLDVRSGTGPWKVAVGRADSTSIEVRGEPLDLKLVAVRDNVARFQVAP